MASSVEICNTALQMIGEDRILALTDNTRSARACNFAYEPVRLAELRAHPWNFALARTVLAPTSSTPAFNYSYEFQLPSDFLRLHPDNDYKAETDWQIEGRKILTNDGNTLYLRYIKDIEDPNTMDPLFREALATALAIRICDELTQSNTKKQMLRQDYSLVIARAKQVNAIENISAEPPDDEWYTARL
jgi:hypothetical protein